MRHAISVVTDRRRLSTWRCSCGKNGPILMPWDVERSYRAARLHIAPAILGSVPRIRLKGGRS